MALLTAQPIYKQYMSDAKANLQESPGSSTVIPADGSTNTATPGKTPGITTMQSASQPSGTNVGTRILNDPTIQQANSTRAGTTGASTGFQCSTAKDKTGDNSLQNDVSAMAQATPGGVYPKSVPTNAPGVGRAAGLSQGVDK